MGRDTGHGRKPAVGTPLQFNSQYVQDGGIFFLFLLLGTRRVSAALFVGWVAGTRKILSNTK